MSQLKAVFAGAAAALATAIVLAALAIAAEVSEFTGPQLLTASALWIASGYLAGLRAGEAGILHGLVAGLAGAALSFGLFTLVQGVLPGPVLEALISRGLFLLGLIGGFWGAIGGLFSDIGRAVRARRARRLVAGEGGDHRAHH